ncbi:DUF397 domain-containing protein [Micromonospora sp. NBC_01796]|uniref:DUF397 domain-containing protein n=1 Tax=Micromonospora sp. NBC_01796 TaxID=2975987 RepID=UPI002DDAA843|nr:DUF397 domain-containing protein [Micromonospora sp. NBC_01796]WSA86301.1 DUF397 domain-containing protein [Micromonospora sp. NBC_01796]
MTGIDLARADWRTSRRSSGNGNCVEVALLDATVAVRDSKDRPGPVLLFGREGWTAFVNGTRAMPDTD